MAARCHSGQGPGAEEQWPLVVASVLAAGTLPVPLACAPLVLAEAAGRPRSRRRRAVAGGVLLASAGLLAVVPELLLVPIIVGGMVGLAVTMPAGAHVSYDGLPVIGGGVLIAVALFLFRLRTRDHASPSTASV